MLSTQRKSSPFVLPYRFDIPVSFDGVALIELCVVTTLARPCSLGDVTHAASPNGHYQDGLVHYRYIQPHTYIHWYHAFILSTLDLFTHQSPSFSVSLSVSLSVRSTIASYPRLHWCTISTRQSLCIGFCLLFFFVVFLVFGLFLVFSVQSSSRLVVASIQTHPPIPLQSFHSIFILIAFPTLR